MTKKGRNILLAAAAVLAVAGLFTAFGQKETEKTVITASANNWDSQNLHNAIAKLVVEHAYDGYEFGTSAASSTMNWQSLLAGEVDLDIESWTFNVPSYPDDIARGDIVDLGTLVPDSKQGLYVPRYVIEGDPARGIKALASGLKSVADLVKYWQVFPDDEKAGRGRIYGSLPGWMADEILYKKYEAYGLNKHYEYVRLGDESTLFASLTSAYNQGLPWVGYCYEPTAVTGRLDLVLLDDRPYDAALYLKGECAFPDQELKIVASKKFLTKAPELAEFFKKYKTGSSLISKALAHLDETQDGIDQTAVCLLKGNDELLEQWLPAENAKKLRDYLKTLD